MACDSISKRCTALYVLSFCTISVSISLARTRARAHVLFPNLPPSLPLKPATLLRSRPPLQQSLAVLPTQFDFFYNSPSSRAPLLQHGHGCLLHHTQRLSDPPEMNLETAAP